MNFTATVFFFVRDGGLFYQIKVKEDTESHFMYDVTTGPFDTWADALADVDRFKAEFKQRIDASGYPGVITRTFTTP